MCRWRGRSGGYQIILIWQHFITPLTLATSRCHSVRPSVCLSVGVCPFLSPSLLFSLWSLVAGGIVVFSPVIRLRPLRNHWAKRPHRSLCLRPTWTVLFPLFVELSDSVWLTVSCWKTNRSYFWFKLFVLQAVIKYQQTEYITVFKNVFTSYTQCSLIIEILTPFAEALDVDVALLCAKAMFCACK